MYLIWRMDTTAKGAKKNTLPNVIHLQYFLLKITKLIFKNKKGTINQRDMEFGVTGRTLPSCVVMIILTTKIWYFL